MQVVLDFEHMPGITVDFIGVRFKFEAIVPAFNINHQEEKKAADKTAGGTWCSQNCNTIGGF